MAAAKLAAQRMAALKDPHVQKAKWIKATVDQIIALENKVEESKTAKFPNKLHETYGERFAKGLLDIKSTREFLEIAQRTEAELVVGLKKANKLSLALKNDILAFDSLVKTYAPKATAKAKAKARAKAKE